MEKKLTGEKDQSVQDYAIGLIMFLFMFGYPFASFMIIRHYKEELETPRISDRISNLYQDVRLTGKNYWNLMYYPIFLFRRIMFVAIPTFLFRFSYF